MTESVECNPSSRVTSSDSPKGSNGFSEGGTNNFPDRSVRSPEEGVKHKGEIFIIYLKVIFYRTVDRLFGTSSGKVIG